ncbi:hypothetical protein PACTADRAFT_49552 [Pachysolen tannophilus NRRL Y-2460]|uniref:UDP-N-acetylglucosamine--dolichyl-phosphate N-acetylglucosaminephosphotransferase n=1 Tax=Pachysolen tannophilus NRRL Y-2460 TaxID=669874 RepID=A0A1E4TWM3_PACTA|nr:hypothetical protein PACTADRAFT_49552 [Pachysolen tannophilus NRRL Y-2460]
MGNFFGISFLILALALLLNTHSAFQPLQTSVAFSILGYNITCYVIPRAKDAFIKIGLYGKDMSKKGKPIIPETIGIIPAITYIFLMFCFIPFLFLKFLVIDTSGGGNREIGISQDYDKFKLFPHNKLSSYLSGMLSLESMILLGLIDDLFDIRWRHKFFLPAIASIPLLIVYYVDFGVTSILIPNFIKNYFELPFNNIDLKFGYYIYMAAVSIFCPNSINILAGVNGLEVGQSLVLSILLLLNDSCYLIPLDKNSPSYDSHLFSAAILIPYIGVSLALLKFNWYPSQVFVGDTFCYFSGMVFAIVGILGHFSKTLLLFFIPQIFNFLYSVPQLFAIIPCPRHRLPHFNPQDNKLYPSRVIFDKRLNPIKEKILILLENLKLLSLIKEKDIKTGEIIVKESSNFTIINLILVWFGPLREDHLCLVILILQFLVGVGSLIARHTIGPWLFGYDNLHWLVQ